MPTPIDAPFFDDPNRLGNKKSTPATIHSAGANLCNTVLFVSGFFFIFHFSPKTCALERGACGATSPVETSPSDSL